MQKYATTRINLSLLIFVQEETTQELTVVGVRVEEEAVVAFRNSPYSSPSETQGTCSRFRLVPSTVVHFVAKRYRLVFVLDFSPSTLSVVCFMLMCLKLTPYLHYVHLCSQLFNCSLSKVTIQKECMDHNSYDC